MTFKHKLSKRLAISRDRAAAFAALLLVGCTSADRTVVPTNLSFSSTIS